MNSSFNRLCNPCFNPCLQQCCPVTIITGPTGPAGTNNTPYPFLQAFAAPNIPPDTRDAIIPFISGQPFPPNGSMVNSFNPSTATFTAPFTGLYSVSVLSTYEGFTGATGGGFIPVRTDGERYIRIIPSFQEIRTDTFYGDYTYVPLASLLAPDVVNSLAFTMLNACPTLPLIAGDTLQIVGYFNTTTPTSLATISVFVELDIAYLGPINTGSVSSLAPSGTGNLQALINSKISKPKNAI